MDDFARANSETLLKELECPVCMEYMVPPIKLCTKGHNICSKCRECVQLCPTCGAEFSDIRCLALENIARSHKHPCANWQSGCRELFSIEHIAEHQDVCVYGKIQCPFKLNKNCSWNGYRSDLIEHAKAVHSTKFFKLSELCFRLPSHRSYRFGDGMKLLSCFGQLFVHYKRIVDGKLYCAVQLIGTSREASKYKCEFTLRAANGIEQISKTFLAHGYSEDFETIFNNGKCLRLDEETINLFVVDKKLNLTVTLSTV